MKGVIIKCLKDMVIEKFGMDKWKAIAEKSGLDPFTAVKTLDDIEDAKALKIVESTCSVLNVSLPQAADAFGDYWVNVFAPKIYSIYYEGVESAREFILKMDDLHTRATSHIKNAKPPRFEYSWKDDKTLLVTYKSHRGLIDFFAGLARGVGRYYNENLIVTKLSETLVEIKFES
jgi:hypothetical protein